MARLQRWIRTLWPLWLVLAATLVLALILFLPPVLVAPYTIQDPDKRFADENALRTTMAGAMGGLAVLAGAVVGALTFRETSRQNHAVLNLQHRGQVTERFTRAIELLGQQGSDKLDVRVGAVYALEQIARDSSELHWPVMEVLCAYLRKHETDASDPWPADREAIAAVIRRRREGPFEAALDLRGANLRGVIWSQAILTAANLRGANLENADLTEAKLMLATLCDANLENADLHQAGLMGADLQGADLKGANLRGVTLFGANLRGALLDGSDLTGAVGLKHSQIQETDGDDPAVLTNLQS